MSKRKRKLYLSGRVGSPLGAEKTHPAHRIEQVRRPRDIELLLASLRFYPGR